MTSKQIDEILAKTPLKRYKYFMRTAVKEEQIWSLSNDEGWLLLDLASNQDKSAFAVFPHEEFAEIFHRQVGYEGFSAVPLDLYEFIEWLDGLEAEHIEVAVFPTPDLQSVVVRAAHLKDDFQAEFDKDKDENED